MFRPYPMLRQKIYRYPVKGIYLSLERYISFVRKVYTYRTRGRVVLPRMGIAEER